MKKRLVAKFISREGDTLVETLVAMLIAVLATTLLATMVMASTSAAASSQDALKATYQAKWNPPETLNSASITYGTIHDIAVKVTLYQSVDSLGNIIFERYQNEAWRPS